MEKNITIHLKGSASVAVSSQGLSGLKALQALGIDNTENLAAVKINGEIKDVSTEIDSSAKLEPVYVDSQEGLQILRHSAAHVMAEAVKALFPGVKVTIGPAIKDGFYYDFDYKRPFDANDLPKIESKMAEIIRKDLPFIRSEVPSDEAIEFFKSQGETYKVELIEDLSEEVVSIYKQGNFTDLCRGPHLPSTGKIRAFHLTHVAGAYWRGDETKAMLSRIYGIAFADQESLNTYLENLEEAKKRDHRKLGPELDLFSIQDDVGPGLILWHPKGGTIRTIIEDFWRQEHYKAGYDIVYSPHIGRAKLWQTSGHLDYYQENMYSPMDIEGQEFYIKPMNCPFHIAIYRSRIRSYRELPLRWAEMGTVYRYERSGVLHGLLRVRGFTQDDAHIFCRPDQIEDEILNCLDLTLHLLRSFGFYEYEVMLSVRDPERKKKYIGNDEMWEMAEGSLVNALERRELSYRREEGEAVFYGPKIDIKIKDALGRAWQCTTIQFDFTLPERFNMTFIGKDGQEHRPYMVHRALLGSLERFFGILIEHYGAAFPVWLAPVQVIILTITDRNIPYGEDLLKILSDTGVRAEKDFRNQKLSFKVREAQTKKIPYMVIIGDKEMETGNVTVRLRDGHNLPPMPPTELIDRIKNEVKLKSA
ncbi:MAG: threonine--tRNA ligase [Deltaproteobacteria bacterium]|nr:threonine--tRNA ligase [Deltaproteobacteria bacterium]MBW2106686.1 threonine--tRNA ligase [Deltaproteobacteria bacterium]HDH86877.1 threonine--tRNA ligase [Desulfobacteraceae bacterium]